MAAFPGHWQHGAHLFDVPEAALVAAGETGWFFYGIYLYAGLGKVPVKNILAEQGFSGNASQFLWLMCLVLLCVAVPIFLELAVQRVKFPKTLVMGKKL